MILNSKKTFLASILAFIIGTSCCWIPWLLIMVGGASAASSLVGGLEMISMPFLLLGLGLISYSIYKINKNKASSQVNIISHSTITCPLCNFSKEEKMPTNACQFFYECESCKKIIKPKEGDCCVYCSYGTIPCPPIQLGEACC